MSAYAELTSYCTGDATAGVTVVSESITVIVQPVALLCLGGKRNATARGLRHSCYARRGSGGTFPHPTSEWGKAIVHNSVTVIINQIALLSHSRVYGAAGIVAIAVWKWGGTWMATVYPAIQVPV